MTNTNIPRFPYAALTRRTTVTIDCGLTPAEIAQREKEFLAKWRSATSRVTAQLIISELKRRIPRDPT